MESIGPGPSPAIERWAIERCRTPSLASVLMKTSHSLPVVSVRDLVRKPGEVLRRVERGERFIVCRHRQPVATLQPIDGWVGDSDGRNECDIYGSPLGDQAQEAGKLTQTQKDLLIRARRGRLLFGGQVDFKDAVHDLSLRGFTKWVPGRGDLLTGRGTVVKEWLELHLPARPGVRPGP